jgi:phage tail sheath protein FI
MAYQLSPGVNITEIDLTTVVPATGASEGAIAGCFEWGPLNQIVTVSNEIELADRFGTPTTNSAVSFFSAANFLAYGNNLKVVRAANTTSFASNTASGGSANGTFLILNEDDYMLNYRDMQASANKGQFAAKYAGTLGNGIRVAMLADATAFSSWNYADDFDGAPSTSIYTTDRGGANDEMHIIVIDRFGKISGKQNTVLEKFGYVSKAGDAKNEDGSSNYYVDVIAQRSKYIYVINHAANSDFGTAASRFTFDHGDTSTYDETLAGGTLGLPAAGHYQTAYDKFLNKDEVDVSLIVTGGVTQPVSEYIVDNIAEVRKDCVVFISPQLADVVGNDGDENTDIATNRNLYNSSSYAFMDSGWKYQFDKYNNVYRWIPLNGDIAGLCVRTDQQRDPWFSPAGFNRGQIKNVAKLAWNPTKAQRDELYKIGVNPVVSFPGEGVVLYGDKTMLAKPSAFDRINVRRLFIVLEKAIARASRYSLFEFNDEFTRAQFVALIEPFLRDVQGRRGIYDFRVVCDETNNTPEVIDRNEFIGDIYIKPARSINFIQLNFVAVRTGVAFSEVVGKF